MSAPAQPGTDAEVDVQVGPAKISLRHVTEKSILLTGALAGLGCALGSFVHLDHLGGALGVLVGATTSLVAMIRAMRAP